MRYWWVNQNQTFRQEFEGGYLWSPKRKANGDRNPFYEFMREVAPGDLIFSFAGQRIRAFGIAKSYAYEAPKPEEFGEAGRNWEKIGWRIDVGFREIVSVVRPADWIERLRPLLPERYSPLIENGRGVQSIYLTRLDAPLALAIADIVGPDVAALARTELAADRQLLQATPEVALWEEHLRKDIERDPRMNETEKLALVLARRGQGRFREAVQRIESRCRITGVDRPEYLRASHCKPWRDCTNEERLDAENGLLLTPSIDHLFDRGFITFSDAGTVLISPVAHRESLERMGVAVDRAVEVGRFTARQRGFLEYHREDVFLSARVGS